MSNQNQKPLSGLKVIEMAGLGPTPFAAMMLADMGAEVVRIERPNTNAFIDQDPDFLNRSRGFVELNLKDPKDLEKAKALINSADILIDGMRPKVMEKLGLGPEEFEMTNPKLIYGRMTGWGQDGPLAHTAGHDINYIAITGALHAIGAKEEPSIPLNLVGDFGGGSHYLVSGILAALYHVSKTGKGQVIDAAIVDGTSHLMSMQYSLMHSKKWQDKRHCNFLDGGAPYYNVYQCADGKHISVGAIEKQFYACFISLFGIATYDLPAQNSFSEWPQLYERFAQHFKTKTRDQWMEIFEGTDACVAPVLSMEEAQTYPHNQARGNFQRVDDHLEPSPAPKFSKTPITELADTEATPFDADEIITKWQHD